MESHSELARKIRERKYASSLASIVAIVGSKFLLSEMRVEIMKYIGIARKI